MSDVNPYQSPRDVSKSNASPRYRGLMAAFLISALPSTLIAAVVLGLIARTIVAWVFDSATGHLAGMFVGLTGGLLVLVRFVRAIELLVKYPQERETMTERQEAHDPL